MTAMLREQAWQLCSSPRLMERIFAICLLTISEALKVYEGVNTAA
jgi:hypothetical protein